MRPKYWGSSFLAKTIDLSRFRRFEYEYEHEYREAEYEKAEVSPTEIPEERILAAGLEASNPSASLPCDQCSMQLGSYSHRWVHPNRESPRPKTILAAIGSACLENSLPLNRLRQR
jgi:hypothetical protein